MAMKKMTKERLTYYGEDDVIQRRLQDDDRERFDNAKKNGKREYTDCIQIVFLSKGYAIITPTKNFYMRNGVMYNLRRWTSTALEPSSW
jgi:hypothetical protein